MADYDAFLLVSFGGPEGPDDVMPFLQNVTRGRGIPPERLEAVARHYDAVGGVSPINQQCRDLITAIGKDFATAGVDLPIYWGNRNWDPYLTRTVAEMTAAGVRRALAFVTSAYGSYSSCRQYLDDIERARAEAGPALPRSTRSGTSTAIPVSPSRSRTRPGGPSRRCRPGPARASPSCSRHTAFRRPWPRPAGPRPAAATRRSWPRRPGSSRNASTDRRTQPGGPPWRASLAAGLPEPQRAALAALARP